MPRLFVVLKPVSCPKLKDPSSFLQDASATAFRLVKGKKGKKRAKQPAFKKFLIHITISNRIFYTFATVSSAESLRVARERRLY